MTTPFTVDMPSPHTLDRPAGTIPIVETRDRNANMTTHRLPLPELALGQSTVLELDDKRVFLCRSAAGVHAMLDVCPHQEKSLEGARIRHGSIMCPHHGARFSLDDGRSLSPLTPNSLNLLPCRAVNGALEIDV